MKLNNILYLLFIICLLSNSCYNSKLVIEKNNNNTKRDTILSIQPEKIYKNQILSDNIKTVLCINNDKDIVSPIIRLSSNDKITISFDDLDTGIKEYTFTIVHCNSEWKSSKMIPSEYINGFINNYITDYELSFNTIQKYTHYKFTLPNENIKPIISGNYIIIISDAENKEVVHKRFMVLDTQISIDAQVRRATLAEDRNTKHEIDFIIKHNNLDISNPFSDLKVKITQNNREDNIISNLTPVFIKNKELIYDYETENTFWGNNEFRYFDIRSLRFQSERIQKITYDSLYNHVFLLKDKMRSFEQYSINADINGEFIINCQEAWNSENEADYTFVHFKLDSDMISYGDVYIIGALSDWEIKEEFKLEYNFKKKQYEKKIYIKQGYYNYQYAIKDNITHKVNVHFTEGTHYQTRNDYYIYVYHRKQVNAYDRLIGFFKTSSKELF